MPLSKERNKERMRQLRSVQPKPLEGTPWIDDIAEFVDSASEELGIFDNPDIKESIVGQVKRLYPDKKIPNCP